MRRRAPGGAMGAAVLLILWAMPGAAFETDYAALFRARAAQVMQAEPGVRRLELPGPVIIEEVRGAGGTPRYRARDLSGRGAVGCGLALLLDLVARGGLCAGMLRPEERAVLEGHLWRVARFAAENAFPPMPEAELRPALVARLQSRLGAYRQSGEEICPTGGGASQGLGEMARNLARPGASAAIDRLVGLKRLPVMDPCETR